MDSSSDSFDDSYLDDQDDDAFDFFSGHAAGTMQDTDEESKPALEGRPPLVDVHGIRILHIHPAQSGSEDVIRCHFERTSLLDPAEYMALSYAWGEEPQVTKTIFVDDSPYTVTSNLLEALYRLRDRRTWIPAIWIDALCIDQENPVERSRQVMLMDKIYSNAKHLIIWLGEMAEEIGSIHEANMGALVDQFSGYREHYEVEQAAWANSQLRERAYFTRRWVVQEVLSCAGPHTIIVGKYQFLSTNVADVLGDRSRPLVFVPGGCESPLYMSKLLALPRRDASSRETDCDQASKSKSLFHNLFDFASKQCSDERDVIYALRNVSQDGRYLEVDYTKNAISTYIILAWKWIAAGHLRTILQLAILQKLRLDNINRPASRKKTDFVRQGPSWVPIWSSPSASFQHLGISNSFGREKATRAVLDIEQVRLKPLLKTDGRPGSLAQCEGECLRVRGSILFQCDHYPQGSDSHYVEADCAYCFLSAVIQAPSYKDGVVSGGGPAGGIWFVLSEPSIAVGVELSTQTDEQTGDQAYVLRTPVYDIEIENQAWYNPHIQRSFPIPEPGIVTLV